MKLKYFNQHVGKSQYLINQLLTMFDHCCLMFWEDMMTVI